MPGCKLIKKITNKVCIIPLHAGLIAQLMLLTLMTLILIWSTPWRKLPIVAKTIPRIWLPSSLCFWFSVRKYIPQKAPNADIIDRHSSFSPNRMKARKIQNIGFKLKISVLIPNEVILKLSCIQLLMAKTTKMLKIKFTIAFVLYEAQFTPLIKFAGK